MTFGISRISTVRSMTNPVRYFNSSPDVIRLAVMMVIRYPLSPRDARHAVIADNTVLPRALEHRLGAFLNVLQAPLEYLALILISPPASCGASTPEHPPAPAAMKQVNSQGPLVVLRKPRPQPLA